MLEGSGVSQQGSKAVKDGVQVIQGTPKEPITRATLFLRLWRVPGPKKTEVTRATLSMVRRGRSSPRRADRVAFSGRPVAPPLDGCNAPRQVTSCLNRLDSRLKNPSVWKLS